MFKVGRVGVEEGLAEAIQETLTTFGGGLEAGKGFDEMFNNKEFAKQLGEAAAAGFFGGMPFGTINPSVKALKVLNRMGGVNNKLDGSTIGGTLNDDPDQEPIQSAPFDIGSTVTIDNEYNEDVDTERQAELEKLAKDPKIIASIEQMNRDIASGLRSQFEAKDYYHYQVIKQMFDDQRRIAWAQMTSMPEVALLREKQRLKTVRRQRKTDQSANLLSMYK